MLFCRIVMIVVLGLAVLTPMANACPLCKEAVSASGTGGDDDEANNWPAAMNQSIYVMIGVPYTAFAILGFLIYRGVKKNAEHKALMESPGAVVPGL